VMAPTFPAFPTLLICCFINRKSVTAFIPLLA
jgi:hypothetical protein